MRLPPRRAGHHASEAVTITLKLTLVLDVLLEAALLDLEQRGCAM